jgi:hemerythrin-like domain-containing protein
VRLLDELRAEHARIDAVLGSLRTYVERRRRGEAAAGDAAGFLRFLERFAGRYHHGREEQLLLPALVEHTGLSTARGPLPALVGQHREMEAMLKELAALLAGEPLSDADGQALEAAATRYTRALWRHIDAENSVLLPESEARLRRAGVFELPTRPLAADELAAREEGDGLVTRYPPLEDREAVRGEGCVVCPSHGSLCGGVEREWWSDEEWDDFFDRVG